MKKLIKAIDKRQDTIEAYACSGCGVCVTCLCSCNEQQGKPSGPMKDNNSAPSSNSNTSSRSILGK